jgi:hypothetical protein
MKDLVEVDTFTTDIEVPEDFVDLRNAASVEVGFQGLANRTKHLKDHSAFGPTPAASTANAVPRWSGTSGRLLKDSPVLVEDDGDVTGVQDITLSGEILYTAEKTRTIVLPARLFVPVAGTAWAWSDTDHRWQIPADDSASDFMWLDFALPVGVKISKFEVLVESTEGANRGMGARLFEKSFAASFGDGSDIGGGATSGAVPINTVTIVARTLVSPPTTTSALYRLRAQKGSPAGAGATFDRIGDARITILVPGPRTA